MVEIRRYQSLRVTSLGTSPRPDGLGIIAGFGSRITFLRSKNSCETTTPYMSLLLVHVSWGPLCTYPSTLCVYHPPIKNLLKNEQYLVDKFFVYDNCDFRE
jgi:ABC-type antimicrobial peptide transport system ATPase subunit